MRRTALCAIAAFVIAGGSAVAHEQSLHKGRPTEGRVASVSGNGLVLETDKGKVSVTLTDTTKMERDEKPIARKEIQTGDLVSVFGTKLETGELVAREIVVHAPGQGGHERDMGDHRQ